MVLGSILCADKKKGSILCEYSIPVNIKNIYQIIEFPLLLHDNIAEHICMQPCKKKYNLRLSSSRKSVPNTCIFHHSTPNDSDILWNRFDGPWCLVKHGRK